MHPCALPRVLFAGDMDVIVVDFHDTHKDSIKGLVVVVSFDISTGNYDVFSTIDDDLVGASWYLYYCCG